MSVFGFIENFFFISLALVFVLVLLLVYHFKNRITVAEKKSESMYGLLTAVVKEIKTLRGMFGLGGPDSSAPTPTPTSAQVNPPSQFEIKSKTTPEISNLSETKPGSIAPVIRNEPREVITLDFSKSENKIVVSDVEDDDSDEDDDESDESSISDDDEGEDSDDDDDDISIKDVKEEVQSGSIPERETSIEIGRLSRETHEVVEMILQEVDLDTFYQPTCDETPVSAENEIDATLVENLLVENLLVDTSSPVLNIHPQEPQQTESIEEVSFSQDNALLTFDISSQAQTPTFQIDQLRRMNINQLKTIASQIGITADISKTKKPELISLIHSHFE